MSEPSVIDEIAAERRRQIDVEGWTPNHDDEHGNGQLARAAACYAAPLLCHAGSQFNLWPWDWRWWKPKSRRRDLIRAAALIVAEIERLDRLRARGCASCEHHSIDKDRAAFCIHPDVVKHYPLGLPVGTAIEAFCGPTLKLREERVPVDADGN